MIGAHCIEDAPVGRELPKAASGWKYPFELFDERRCVVEKCYRHGPMPQVQVLDEEGLDSLVIGHDHVQCALAVASSVAGRNGLTCPCRYPLATTAQAAQIAGTAPAMNICCGVHSIDSMMPPSIGPTIDPMRPMPSAQPTPVERITVG